MGRPLRWAVRVATWIAVALGLFVAARGVSPRMLSRVLRATDVGFVAAAVAVLTCAGFAVRAWRFRSVLGRTRVSFPGTVATVLLSQAANNLLPVRAGELIKTRDFVAAGQPLGRVVAAQCAEKLVEATTLLMIFAPALVGFGYGRGLPVLAAPFVGAVALLVWISRRFGIGPAQLGRAFAWSMAADAVEIALVAVTLRGLGLGAGLRTSVIVVGVVNLAIALPSMPGSIGALEASAALALVSMGVAREAALAFAILYRLVQWIPVTAAGAVVWAWRRLARRPGGKGRAEGTLASRPNPQH
jgi:glycosyltransferase 2 family protein